MKTCPNCNSSHADDNLSFCTSCGTPLTFSGQSADDPSKTLVSNPGTEFQPPTPFSNTPSFMDPNPSLPSSQETMIAPPSLFSDPSPSMPSFNEQQPQPVRPFSEQPTVNRPFAEPPPQQSNPSGQSDPFQPLFGTSQPPVQQNYSFGQQSIGQPEWTPPPPPGQSWGSNQAGVNYAAYTQAPQQTLALISMITGIASCTVGFCCYSGTILGPTAIIMGIIALVQIKNNPQMYTGKGMAIGGIIGGALYFVLIILFIIFWGAINIIGAFA